MNGPGASPGFHVGAETTRTTGWRAAQHAATQDYELLTTTAIPLWDVGKQQVRLLTLLASTTHTMPFPVGAKRGATYILYAKQPAVTGAAAISWTNQVGVAPLGVWRWPAATAPTLTTTAAAASMLTFFFDGLDMIGVSVLDLR